MPVVTHHGPAPSRRARSRSSITRGSYGRFRPHDLPVSSDRVARRLGIVALLPWIYTVWRKRSLRLSIAVHISVNVTFLLLVVAAVR
jgi:hypothetical protein